MQNIERGFAKAVYANAVTESGVSGSGGSKKFSCVKEVMGDKITVFHFWVLVEVEQQKEGILF